MSWRTSRLAVHLRRVARAAGLTRPIAGALLGSGYENAFEGRLLKAIRPGNTVWDVGANIGYYTSIFSSLVGHSGRVYAFEPSSENFTRLTRECSRCTNTTLLPFGLGAQDMEASFEQGSDDLGATSRVTGPGSGGGGVRIRSGDGVVQSGEAAVPHVIKIDVEGYEWEVLCGMTALLLNDSLRWIGIEVHFGLLEMRDMNHVPRQIEKVLRKSGFAVEWLDSSHLFAERQP